NAVAADEPLSGVVVVEKSQQERMHRIAPAAVGQRGPQPRKLRYPPVRGEDTVPGPLPEPRGPVVRGVEAMIDVIRIPAGSLRDQDDIGVDASQDGVQLRPEPRVALTHGPGGI